MTARVPPGWRKVRIQDLGEVVAGRQRSPSASGTPRPYLRVANVLDGAIDTSDVLTMPFTDREYERFRLVPGDVLLNEGQSRDLVGRSAQYHGSPPDCCFQNTIIRFRASSGTDAGFARELFAWLQRRGRFSEIATQTTSIAHLGVNRFAQLVVHVPDLREQREIAATLKAVDGAVAAGEGVVKQLDCVRCELAKTLFRHGDAAGWRPCYLEEMGTTGEAALITGPFGSALKTEHFTRNGVPVLTIASLGLGEVRREGLFYTTTAKAEELRSYAVQAGDLVFSRVADVGRSVVVPSDGNGWIISSNLMRIRLDKRRFDPRFVMYSITTSPGVLRQLAGLVSNGGRSVVSVPALRRLRIPCPEVQEQRRMADAIESVQNRMYLEELHTTELMRRFKSSLADALLSGRVRVRDAA